MPRALAALALALAATGGSSAGRAPAQTRRSRSSDKLGHAFTRAHARALAAWAAQLAGNAPAAVRHAESALALQSEVEAPYFFAIAHHARGWALSISGRHAEGIAQLERALAIQREGAADFYAALTATSLVETYLRAHRPDLSRIGDATPAHPRRNGIGDTSSARQSCGVSRPACARATRHSRRGSSIARSKRSRSHASKVHGYRPSAPHCNSRRRRRRTPTRTSLCWRSLWSACPCDGTSPDGQAALEFLSARAASGRPGVIPEEHDADGLRDTTM